MRNRAKCKLCNSIIESFHSEDYCVCTCDEIAVFGGSAMRCGAKNFSNFVRVDDEGNEIMVTVIKDSIEPDVKQLDIGDKPTRDDLLTMLHDYIKAIDGLPEHAKTAPVTNYDLSAALSLMLAVFRSQ